MDRHETQSEDISKPRSATGESTTRGVSPNELLARDAIYKAGTSGPRVPPKLVKAQQTIIPDGFHDESGEIYERIGYHQWLYEAVSARSHCYFWGRRSEDGWEFGRYRVRQLR